MTPDDVEATQFHVAVTLTDVNGNTTTLTGGAVSVLAMPVNNAPALNGGSAGAVREDTPGA